MLYITYYTYFITGQIFDFTVQHNSGHMEFTNVILHKQGKDKSTIHAYPLLVVTVLETAGGLGRGLLCGEAKRACLTSAVSPTVSSPSKDPGAFPDGPLKSRNNCQQCHLINKK